MRLALTHNLQTGHGEDEAEFDPPELIETLCASLERQGHAVDPVDVSHDLPDAIARLQESRPELVFNLAEGRRGPLREALVPALLEELGLRYTGSGAATMAMTLDKRLAKTLAAAAGLPTPSWRLVTDPADPRLAGLEPPLIVKPNFEGSSKGIHRRSVVEAAADLPDAVGELLHAYPEGVLVERLVGAADVSLPFLEGVQSRDGVLEPVGYLFHRASSGPSIYDYELKNELSDLVELLVPARLPDGAGTELQRVGRALFELFGVRDFGRADFRVEKDGRLFFLELNPLPYLHPEAGIFASAALEGLDLDEVLGSIVESAAARFGLPVA